MDYNATHISSLDASTAREKGAESPVQRRRKYGTLAKITCLRAILRLLGGYSE